MHLMTNDTSCQMAWTQPFGHYRFRDKFAMQHLENDSEWESGDYDDSLLKNNNSGYVDFIEGGNAPGLETPDMGFNQRVYDSDKLEACVDFSFFQTRKMINPHCQTIHL